MRKNEKKGETERERERERRMFKREERGRESEICN